MEGVRKQAAGKEDFATYNEHRRLSVYEEPYSSSGERQADSRTRARTWPVIQGEHTRCPIPRESAKTPKTDTTTPSSVADD